MFQPSDKSESVDVDDDLIIIILIQDDFLDPLQSSYCKLQSKEIYSLNHRKLIVGCASISPPQFLHN